MRMKALRAAFPGTVPVMMGYGFLGMAFGILLTSRGFGAGWALLMSVAVYAGAMQFVAVGLLAEGAGLASAFLMTLMVNARHLFYGLSMLERFKGLGWKRPYLVFALTDETFSILCGLEPAEDVDRGWYCFFVSALDQAYWVLGSLGGALLGERMFFDGTGVGFAMTALFVVIFLEQWKGNQRHGPAMAGVVLSLVSLGVFGPDRFILPSMLLILSALLLSRKRMEKTS
ncbi:AzlC family ABC transporter permease [Anaerotalea alkaliphila]|uniref:Branched-chain amino acid ABC transporter permease n=1 Tax=Anaerotalea alkaliphila TaxID=2662126 RepID=A0A7X5KMT3_9FIRM|nr:AzlC family ABC transporter permease [Anaerotalea alkaliphila]NDL68296.1 branched-chain amino acid ABC transporter permease [Anaerotalea alkaliphila]